MRLPVLLSCLLMAIALGACGTFDNRAGVARVPPTALDAAGQGVILFSTGAPDHCISSSRFLKTYRRDTRKIVDVPLIPVDVYTYKSEFEDHHGTVNALALPPGEYYFSPWMANGVMQGVVIPAFGFEVRAGETTYLGELFMRRSCSDANLYDVRDRYERDMAVAREKNPALLKREPVPRLLALIHP